MQSQSPDTIISPSRASLNHLFSKPLNSVNIQCLLQFLERPVQQDYLPHFLQPIHFLSLPHSTGKKILEVLCYSQSCVSGPIQ
jgi:hypothetical protein